MLRVRCCQLAASLDLQQGAVRSSWFKQSHIACNMPRVLTAIARQSCLARCLARVQPPRAMLERNHWKTSRAHPLDMCSSPVVCARWRPRRSPPAPWSPPQPRRPPGHWYAAHAGVQAQLATAGPTRSGIGSRAAVQPAAGKETEAGSLHQSSETRQAQQPCPCCFQVQALPTLGAGRCLISTCRKRTCSTVGVRAMAVCSCACRSAGSRSGVVPNSCSGRRGRGAVSERLRRDACGTAAGTDVGHASHPWYHWQCIARMASPCSRP